MQDVNKRVLLEKTSSQHFTAILIAILMIGLILRVITIFWIPTVPTEDFWSYFQRAQHLTDFGSYDAVLGLHDASYPPAYPLFLSIIFRLPFDRLMAAKVANVLLSFAVMILLSGISRILFNQKVALVATAIAAISPRLILQNTLIASENLFIPLLLLFVLLSMHWLQNYRLLKVFITGGTLGVLSLTRSISLFLSVPWFFSIIPGIKKNAGKLVKFIIFFLLGQLVVMIPWAIRNYLVLGSGTFLTTTGGIDLFIGNNPHANGEWYYWPPDMAAIYPDFSQQSVVIQNQLAQHEAVRWIIENPGAALKLYFRKLGQIFKNDEFVLDMSIFSKQLSPPYPPADVLIGDHPLKSYQGILNDLVNGFYWSLLFLETVGCLISLSKIIKAKDYHFFSRWLLVVLPALYFPIVAAVFLASTRFHWPATDLLIPFAALSLVLVYEKIKSLIKTADLKPMK
jgi:4-amino-4-deoxy-L-arabinose transferase-like glycosyltransferase